jgi:hypothetical protein
LFSSFYFAAGASPDLEKMYAYIACIDHRLYIIDLASNSLYLKSEEIKEIGNPYNIALDSNKGKLFIANGRGRIWDTNMWSPILVLDIRHSPIKVIDKFDLIAEKTDFIFEDKSNSLKGNPNFMEKKEKREVYKIVLSPDGSRLYVGYGHPDYSKGETIIDSQTGKILGKTNFYMGWDPVFSPDGKQYAGIFPERKIVMNNEGKQEEKEWPARVTVYDIDQNKTVLYKELKGDRSGLYPPWKKTQGPLDVFYRQYLERYDRDTGKIIAKLDLELLTGLKTHAEQGVVYNNGKNAAIIGSSLIGKEIKTFVVTIDLENEEVLGKVEIVPTMSRIVLSPIVPQIPNK